MKLLKHVEDRKMPVNGKIKERFASRAVLFDEKDLVPILFVSKENYHKLPGGGIEKGEDKMEALIREIKEEAGCTAKIMGEVGEVTEYRSRWNLLQTSYCYFGKVLTKGVQDLTKKERKAGFELVWLSLDDAIKALKGDESKNYEGSFIKQRDLTFLEEAEKIIHNV